MDSVNDPPKPDRRKRFRIIGTREMHESALLACQGMCGAFEIVWTRHVRKSGNFYICEVCGDVRRWGAMILFGGK